MSDALNIAANALNSSASRMVKAASSMVNASSTGATGDLAAGLVAIAQEKTNYAADAKVIRAVAENNKTLLNILA
jgi:hypothetical protein